MKLSKNLSSVLIVKTSSLGDIIHTFPAVSYLKTTFPHISIDWVVEKPFAELVQAHPNIDSVFCIDTKKWRKTLFTKNTFEEIFTFKKEIRKKRYDIVFDLQGNLKSSWVTWVTLSPLKAGYGSKTVSEWPNLIFTNSKHDPEPEENVREEILFVVRETLEQLKGEANKLHDSTKDRSNCKSAVPKKNENQIIDDFVANSEGQLAGLKPVNRGLSEWVDKEPRSALATKERFYGLHEFCNCFDNVRLRISSDEEAKIERLLINKRAQATTTIMVCPGSNWSNKQISEHALCDFLQEIYDHLLCRFIFIWGSEKERQQANLLHKIFHNDSIVAPKLRFPSLQNLMDRVDLVIAVDSLALHLAATTQTKTFSLFGPSAASKFRPYGARHHSLQGPCPYGRIFERQCPLLRTCTTGLCLKGLTGKEIFSEFYSWWVTF